MKIAAILERAEQINDARQGGADAAVVGAALRGHFDPITGVKLDTRLRESLEALFATSTPDTCPTDPGAKQDHLRALAFADLILDGRSGSKPGRPEFVVVIDADAPPATGPSVEFSIPVEVPWRVLADLAGDADVHTVVVRGTSQTTGPPTIRAA